MKNVGAVREDEAPPPGASSPLMKCHWILLTEMYNVGESPEMMRLRYNVIGFSGLNGKLLERPEKIWLPLPKPHMLTLKCKNWGAPREHEPPSPGVLSVHPL